VHAVIEKLAPHAAAPPPRPLVEAVLPLLICHETPTCIARDRVIVAVNPPFAAMLHYAPEELIGEHVSFIQAHGAPREMAPPYETVQRQIALRRKDGTVLSRTLTRFPVIVGNVIFHLGVISLT